MDRVRTAGTNTRINGAGGDDHDRATHDQAIHDHDQIGKGLHTESAAGDGQITGNRTGGDDPAGHNEQQQQLSHPPTPRPASRRASPIRRRHRRTSQRNRVLHDKGIRITDPATINGGAYNDPAAANTGPRSVQPIIRIVNTNNVTIKNMNLIGANVASGFHRHLVGQAGLDILSGSNVTVSNVNIANTFGDGMMVFADFDDHVSTPTNHLLVNRVTITQAGRNGVTAAYATNSTFHNVDAIISIPDCDWGFESDLPNVGSSNVTVRNKGVRLIEALHGPITFNSSQYSGRTTLSSRAALSGQPVTFNSGKL